MTDIDHIGQALTDLRAACIRHGLGPRSAEELLYRLAVLLRRQTRECFEAALFETRQRRIGNKPRRPAAQPAETPRPAAQKRVGYGGHARER